MNRSLIVYFINWWKVFWDDSWRLPTYVSDVFPNLLYFLFFILTDSILFRQHILISKQSLVACYSRIIFVNNKIIIRGLPFFMWFYLFIFFKMSIINIIFGVIGLLTYWVFNKLFSGIRLVINGCNKILSWMLIIWSGNKILTRIFLLFICSLSDLCLGKKFLQLPFLIILLNSLLSLPFKNFFLKCKY